NQAIQIASSRFRKSMEEGLDYIFSPIVIVLLIITLLSVVIGLRQAKTIMAEGAVKSGTKRAPLIFLLAILAFVGFAFIDAATMPDYAGTDRAFPRFVALVSLVGGVIILVQMMLKPETDAVFADRESANEEGNTHGLWATLAWFIGLLILTMLLGFILALAIFLFAFIHLRAGRSLGFAAAYTAAGIAFMCFMAGILNRDFPPGMLQRYVDLPWPLS
ncbi:MAG: tripartite tricarboxylate transporter TctB family protein, partial [Pseudomonadota bacterium]